MSKFFNKTNFSLALIYLLMMLGALQIHGASSVQVTAYVLPQCSDSIDNDTDTLTDYPLDPGCASASDQREADNQPVCSDGVDNDGDGLVDYPSDIGCTSSSDGDETNPVPVATSTPTSTNSGGSSGGGGGIPSTIVKLIKEILQKKTADNQQKEITKDFGAVSKTNGPDLNGDGIVSIIDFSILLYRYGNFVDQDSQSSIYDLNGDGVIDITDVSIILYYWS